MEEISMRPAGIRPTKGSGMQDRIPSPSEKTRSINLSSLFLESITSSGSFDLRRLKLTSFGKLLQAIPVATLLINRSHGVEFANDAFKRISRQRIDPEGLSFSSLFPNPKQAREAQVLLEKVFSDRRPVVRERMLQIQGVRIWGRLHVRTVRLDTDRMALVLIENLTAHKELRAIQKYKRLVSIVPIGIAEFALPQPVSRAGPASKAATAVLQARVVDGNDEFARMYKRKEMQYLLGVSLKELLPAKGNVKSLCEKWVESGYPIRYFETKEKRSGGRVRHFENSLIGILSDQHLLGFWWLRRDISEKKKTEEELLKTQKLDSLGMLAGGIAHDFNNLLTGVIGNISSAQMHLDSGHASAERMQKAVNAANKARHLTHQLLTFSRGGTPIKRRAPISGLLKDWVTFALMGSTVRCEFYLPKTLPWVVMDEGQISQVINNLVLNAVQAMPSGGTLKVRASSVFVRRSDASPMQEGNYVKISISDDGVGIPEQHVRKIFDPYFTTKEKGSGLGLATSYSIVKKHGGLITVRSEAGRGTTFHVYLPATLAEERVHRAEEPRMVRGKGAVLVMDDEELIRDLVRELLVQLGYDACTVSDGKEAVRIYCETLKQNRRFDAVIMDLTIPGGMGGTETLQELLAVDPDVKAIASSGYSNNPVMSEYRRHGFKSILPKPYDAIQLSRTLAEVIGCKSR
jgi:two-component system cell cycle sensor histidine kinase/response regulator CckA